MEIKSRWTALLLICIAVLPFTINWFNIIPLFGNILVEFNLEPSELGLMLSAFMLGYGLFHIPVGIFAEKTGLRSTLYVGMVVEALGVLISSSAADYQMVLVGRFVCGAGAAFIFAAVISLVAGWFHGKELAFANGMSVGVAFNVGAAGGLFGWAFVGQLTDWRTALVVGAVLMAIAFVIHLFFYPKVPIAKYNVHPGTSLDSLKRVFLNKRLWLMSIACVGMYGAYLTASGVLPGFAIQKLGVSNTEGSLLGSIILLSGIVGSAFGGLCVRKFGLRKTFFWSGIIEAIAILLIPFGNYLAIEILAFVLGTAFMIGFTAWITLPGSMLGILHLRDIPTAAGLLLTVTAIGPVIIPPIYGSVAASQPITAWWLMALLCALGVLLAIVDWAIYGKGSDYKGGLEQAAI